MFVKLIFHQIRPDRNDIEQIDELIFVDTHWHQLESLERSMWNRLETMLNRSVEDTMVEVEIEPVLKMEDVSLKKFLNPTEFKRKEKYIEYENSSFYSRLKWNCFECFP